MTRLSITATVLACAATAAIAGCTSDSVSPTYQTPANVLAIAPDNSNADGVVRGVTQGLRLTNPADSTSFERVAGASIVVYLEFTQLPADSATGLIHQLMGTLVTDAQGTFELTHVPKGFYELDVTPPAGSPYQFEKAGSLAFDGSSTQSTIVWLTPK